MLGLGAILSGGSVPGFLPTDIDDCKFWFTYEEGVTLDGSAVNSWADRVGDYCAKSPDGGSNRATFNTTHITFDGSDDDMDLYQSDCTTSTTLALDTSDGGWTVIAIYTDGDWNGAQQAIFGKLGDSQDFLRHDVTNDRYEMKINNNLKIIDLDTPSALVDDQYYSIMLTHESDGTITLYVDNVAQSDTESLGNTNDFTISALAQRGTADLLSGHVKHFIAYDKALTSDERSQIQDWASEYIG